MARYIRFRPTAWQGLIAMRVELYGCTGTQCLLFCDFTQLTGLSSSVMERVLLSNNRVKLTSNH